MPSTHKIQTLWSIAQRYASPEPTPQAKNGPSSIPQAPLNLEPVRKFNSKASVSNYQLRVKLTNIEKLGKIIGKKLDILA